MLTAHPRQRRRILCGRGELRRRRQARGDGQRGAVEKIAARDGWHPENLTPRLPFCPCRTVRVEPRKWPCKPIELCERVLIFAHDEAPHPDCRRWTRRPDHGAGFGAA